MAGEELRRSTRVRKPVKSLAAEQGEVSDVTMPTKPAPRKRKKAADDDGDAGEKSKKRKRSKSDDEPAPAKKAKKTKKSTNEDEDFDGTEPAPAKKAKKTKNSKDDDEYVNEDVPTPAKKAKKKSKAPVTDTSWFAEGAERRIAASQRDIEQLAPGEEETRLRPHVEVAPKTYHDSLKRANSQRMFVLDRERSFEENCHAHHTDCPREIVQIAGSTGNAYTVTISHAPTCTCPAGIFKRKGQETLCKHVLYILNNVLKAPEHLMQQNAFLTSELKQIFDRAPPLLTQITEQGVDNDGRKSIEGDCPICFTEFEEGENIVWCRAACGNNIHKDCFDQWARTKMGRVTCPFCRSEWENEAPKAQKVNVTTVDMSAKRGEGGYRNFRDQLDYDDDD